MNDGSRRRVSTAASRPETDNSEVTQQQMTKARINTRVVHSQTTAETHGIYIYIMCARPAGGLSGLGFATVLQAFF